MRSVRARCGGFKPTAARPTGPRPWHFQAVSTTGTSAPTAVYTLFPPVAGTFDHLLQVLPQNVAHEVRCQLQKTLLAQVTQHLAIHAEPLEVDVHQAELIGGPEKPLADLLLRPQPGVWGWGGRKGRTQEE